MTPDNAADPITALRMLLGEFIAFARGRVVAAVVLMLMVAGLEGAGLMLLLPLLELVGVSAHTGDRSAGPFAAAWFARGLSPSLPLALSIYVLLIALHAAVSWQRDLLTSRLQQGFVDHLRQQLFDHIGLAEWAFLARTHSAEFSHALTSDLARVNLGIHALLQILTTGIVALAYTVIALHLSLPLTLITLTAGALLLLALRRHHRHSHGLGQALTRTTQRLHGEVSEFLAGLKLAKSGNAEARLSRRFAEHLQQTRDQVLAFAHQQAAARSLLRVGGAVALAALVYAALAIVIVPAATVLVLVFIFARLFPFLSQLQQSHERLLHTLPAYSAFAGMRARCRQAREPAGGGQGYTLSDVIRLENVSYRHGGAEVETVLGANLTIPCRSTTALIGPSGAGKSTLADLLAGLLLPTEGRVTVDGRPLDDRRAWRQSVAYVPQETFLFNTSVRENLLWVTHEATEAALWNALEQAAAAEFVRALPQQLDTVLGERGIRLSGGERQRLAVARALLRKPLLLVLDEATSALDRENEQRIQKALANLHGHLTIVVIAHRLTTVRHADRIVVMQGGRVAEQGAYAELAASSRGYIARAQADAELMPES